jgi:hypothetical protein
MKSIVNVEMYQKNWLILLGNTILKIIIVYIINLIIILLINDYILLTHITIFKNNSNININEEI